MRLTKGPIEIPSTVSLPSICTLPPNVVLPAASIVTVPLELVSLFFVHGQKRDNYATSILIMSV